MTTLDLRVGHLGGRRTAVSAWGPVALLLLVTGLSIVVGLVASDGAPRVAPAGLPDAGRFTGWALPLARGWQDLAATGTIGCLVVGTWLVRGAEGRVGPAGARLLRVASRWAMAWAGGAACLGLLSTSQLLGVPPSQVFGSPFVYRYWTDLPQGRALLVLVVAAVGVAVTARRVSTMGAGRLLLVTVLVAMAPLLSTGHANTASSHLLATLTVTVHVLAASLWVGGLLALVVHVRGDREALSFALPGFSALALGCFAATALSGLVGAVVRIGVDPETWRSPYGALLLSKSALLVLLGVLGWLHRRRSIPAVLRGSGRAFLRLAAVEVLAMAGAVGLAVVLAATPPPPAAASQAAPPHANVFATVDRGIEPVSAWNLLLQTRPDALVLTALVCLAAGYLLAVRRLQQRGSAWRRYRTLAFLGGVGVVLWALCGGLAAYSAALFSVEVARVLVLGTVAPVLICLGAPIELLRAVGPPPGARGVGGRLLATLTEPVNSAIVFVAVTAAVFMTPLLDASLRSPLLHLLVGVAALGAGTLLFHSLVRPGSAGTRRADNLVLLLVVALLLGSYAAHILTSRSLFGGTWFGELGWWWSDPLADQRRAAYVAGGFSLALNVFALALLTGPLLSPRRQRAPVRGRRSR